MRSILIGVLGALLAGAAAAETWNTYSRSANNAFMADIDSIAPGDDDVVSVRVAMVPLRAESGDRSHSLETYQFQCRQNRWRPAGVVEIGPDGEEADRIPEEGAQWEAVRSGTMPSYLKEIVCDGARAEPAWPSVKAFIDAGRP